MDAAGRSNGCALLFWTAGERLLVFLVLNVLASGTWDFASGRNNRTRIQGGLGGGEEARWATVYVSVADVDQTLSRAEKLGGSRISDPGLSALKSAARAAIYGPSSVDDHMETGAFRDPAGNVFGIYHHGAG